ncbi:cyclin-dependent kinase 7-like [Sycon ciliatum]|uniref:cyclin-dependent kinase 7-like n=1 Tax=Sycon ciliatum TaxID=27933 RepID=UPI0020AED160|eukprot:scpid84359/ scgid33046/ MAPK/MAK/MRK overlapping kinase; MOK protein kinase; Serine/threonine kinase 30
MARTSPLSFQDADVAGSEGLTDYRRLYKKEMLLAKGSFASVYQITAKGEGSRKFAAKISKISMNTVTAVSELQDVEIKVLRLMKESEYVLTLVDVCVDQERPNLGKIIVTELCSGTLEDKMKGMDLRSFVSNAEQAKRYTHQLVCGLADLHHHKIAHRDIKPANILVMMGQDEQWRLKYCDFGHSTITDDQILSDVRGTIPYCAPEEFFCKGFTFKADVWSLAMCVVRFWKPGGANLISSPAAPTGTIHHYRGHIKKIISVFGGITDTTFCDTTKKRMAYFYAFADLCNAPAGSKLHANIKNTRIPQTALDLMDGMFRYDPEARLSAAEATHHPYFQ